MKEIIETPSIWVPTLIAIISLGFNVWQLAINKGEKDRHNSQVKIWQRHAEGIDYGLKNILSRTADYDFSSVKDVKNSVFAIESSAFSLSRSLYEERTITEEEYREEEKKNREIARADFFAPQLKQEKEVGEKK